MWGGKGCNGGGELILELRNDWLVVPEWQGTGPLLGASVTHTQTRTETHTLLMQIETCTAWSSFFPPSLTSFKNFALLNVDLKKKDAILILHSRLCLHGVSLVILGWGGDFDTCVCPGAKVTDLSHYLCLKEDRRGRSGGGGSRRWSM